MSFLLGAMVVFGAYFVVSNALESFIRVIETRNDFASEREEIIVEPQERQITLSDGREVLCLVWPNVNSSCDWENTK